MIYAKECQGCQRFLGLTGYYRKFIGDYGKIARPLTDLTKKEGFKWGVKEKAVFEELKHNVTSAPVLALLDFTKEFFIESDASSNGLGNKLTVCTDQKSLKRLMSQRVTAMDQQNWVFKLLGVLI
ncbi:hypothetical protein TSUD_406690 [Trifolium subterraneum]|uniref:Reverse transcriptase/retrotransposon-derived protein RNase H-like domain-containing protein n=1 Tax=Trifolium subterraneum TaxID=3900 RepID=A0A2Z6NXK6_TRISU|nr:hypothetical protein TSUD_406690 [Trifolium subterraneum]